MTRFEDRRKKILTIAAVTALVILFFIYLYAVSRPGVWHGDAFLYRQKDGSWRGSDAFANYEMQITYGFECTQIRFAVNDTVNDYNVFHTPIHNTPQWDIEITENGASVFKGKTVSTSPVMLLDENENLDIHFSVSTTSDFFEVPTTEELFPTYSKLTAWSFGESYSVRGNLVMLIMIFIFALFLGLDLAFPLLFFSLKHGLDVTGGEPSYYFLTQQKIGRVILVIAIVVCVILTFTMH